MSVIPNDALKPSTNLEMQIFEIKDIVAPGIAPAVTSSYVSDFFSKYGGFWKSLVIRNLDQNNNCSYRMSPSVRWQNLRPSSERPIQGWGSYFEIVTATLTPEIEIDYVGVLQRNAMQQ